MSPFLADSVAKLGKRRLTRNNRIGAKDSLNRCCALIAVLESMLPARAPKIVLQQNLPDSGWRADSAPGQFCDRITVYGGEAIRHYDQTAVGLCCDRYDGMFELGCLPNRSLHYFDHQQRGRGFDVSEELLAIRSSFWVKEECDLGSGGCDLAENFEPFASHGEFEIRETGDISARSCQASNEASTHGIDHLHKHERYGPCLLTQSCQDWRGIGDNQFGR